MLLIDKLRHRETDDSGMALVLVVFIMFVGFIAATVVAAAVFFVINTNSTNKSHTQAFVAAESGRDQLRANLVAAYATTPATCTGGTLHLAAPLGTSESYVSDARAVSASRPPSTFDATLPAACPDQNTNYIVVRSVGTGADGSTSTIVSTFDWQVVPHSSASGFMAGTNGSFHGVGGGGSSSTYVGDLVVRTTAYTCSGSEVVKGDLWVLGGSDGSSGGNVVITGGCSISGNIYANGTVKTNGTNPSQTIMIGKSIIAGGGVTMSSNSVSVGGGCTASDGATCGRIASGGAVSLTNTGGNTGTVVGTVTGTSVPVIQSQWTHPGPPPSPILGTIAPSPTFPVPLNSSQTVGNTTAGTVWSMTSWIDLTASTVWGNPSPTRYSCPLPSDTGPTGLKQRLQNATGPIILDYTGATCGATHGNTTTLDIGSATVPLNIPQDVVFLIDPGNTMDVNINGSLTGPSNPTSQIFLVHETLGTGNPSTDCGLHGAGAGDDVTVGNYSISPRIMIYTACGLNGSWTGSVTGQLYVGGSISYNGNYTCLPMTWTATSSPMPTMACSILGSGGASGGTTYDLSLGGLSLQVEQ